VDQHDKENKALLHILFLKSNIPILSILLVLILYHQWIKKNKEIKVLLQMCKRKKLHLVLPILVSLILYLSSQNKEVNAESASNVIINANSSIHDSI